MMQERGFNSSTRRGVIIKGEDHLQGTNYGLRLGQIESHL